MRIIVAVTAAALQAQGPLPLEQGAVGVGAVLPAAVGMDHQVRGGGLGEQGPPQGRSDEFFGHSRSHMPADHVLGVLVLESAQVGHTGYDP